MQANPLHFYCVVDSKSSSSRRRLTAFQNEMAKRYPCKFTIEEFDGADVSWEIRNKKAYATDTYVFSYTERIFKNYGKEVDAVKFFVDDKNWLQDAVRLNGFKLGRIFNTYYATFTRYRNGYEGTAEHEVLHFVDEYIKANIGVSLEAVLGVKDFDDDVVHNPSASNYDYDAVWLKIADHLSNAVYARRQETATNRILLMKQYVTLLLQYINLLKYQSNSIPALEIKKMHTVKKYELYGAKAVIGHIDLGTEQGTINEILNGPRSASYHWYIPRHAKYVVEFVPFGEGAWHAGVVHEPDQTLLGDLLGGNDRIITSGEPNRYSYGVCYEGATIDTPPTQAQINLAHQLMLVKKIEDLKWYSHWQVTSYKPRIVSKFADGVNALLGKK